MKLLKNQIFIGVMIILLSGAIGGIFAIGTSLFVKVNYELPDKNKEINRRIRYNEFTYNFRDSLMLEKKKVQDKFIYENRAMTRQMIRNDSILTQTIKEIKIVNKILLKNSKKSMEDLKEFKNLFGNNNYVELKNN